MSIVSGVDRDGVPYGMMNLDPMGGGHGALPFRDGVDTGGHIWDPVSLMPNVEFVEQSNPILYLYRREQADSGGAGTFRGGNGGVVAITPHKVPGLTVDISASGMALPLSDGIFGGFPSTANGGDAVSNTNLTRMLSEGKLPTSVEDVGGEVLPLPPKLRNHELAAGDMFELRWNGGGGLGDPLARDPARVARDVEHGLISEGHGRDAYGVVLEDGEVDAEATRELRRSKGITQPSEPGDEKTPLPRYDRTDETWHCPNCDALLGNNTDGYLADTVTDDRTVEDLTPVNRPTSLFVDPEVVFRSHACSSCGQHVEGYLTVPSVADLSPDIRFDS